VKTIHLATEDGTNARVLLLRPRRLRPRTVKVTAQGEAVASKTVHRGIAYVAESLDTQTVIEADREIDFQNVGRIIPETTRAYRRPGGAALEGNFQVIVTTYGVDGAVKGRSLHTPRQANINELVPVRMGRRIALKDLFASFVFHNQFYLGHEDGLQYEFLFALARRLRDRRRGG
jgi:hypothetical protein